METLKAITNTTSLNASMRMMNTNQITMAVSRSLTISVTCQVINKRKIIKKKMEIFKGADQSPNNLIKISYLLSMKMRMSTKMNTKMRMRMRMGMRETLNYKN
jgi:hypothetical protein